MTKLVGVRMPTDALQTRAARAKDWLFEACFPFWAELGPHPAGGFRETLTLDGTPQANEPVARVRVQARQTYVFAHAALMGWHPARAEALVRRGVQSLLEHCRRSDGLFGRTVRLGRGLEDDQADLYDCAFAVFGLAWAARALGDDAPMAAARAALAAIDAHLAHPAGGYRERLPQPAPRLQNPHMHLFEASLACFAADENPAHLVRGAAIRDLWVTRFVDQKSARLMEYFADDWTALDGGDQVVEPGHELEWTWLMHADAAARGGVVPPLVERVYANACQHLDARGLAPQSVGVDGTPRDASRRSWPQTEALKAHLARYEAGDATAAARAAVTFDALMADYVDPAPAGGWIDHYDADGQPIAKTIPASTGYHIVLALAELIRVAEGE